MEFKHLSVEQLLGVKLEKVLAETNEEGRFKQNKMQNI